jgi:hypothetical protein
MTSVSRIINDGTAIANIICPDGERRRFFITGTTPAGHNRGYVQVKGRSVAGYAKARGNGYQFFPHIASRHVGLVRPKALAVLSRVRLSDGTTGTIMEVTWNYLTPSYVVRPDRVEVSEYGLTAL